MHKGRFVMEPSELQAVEDIPELLTLVFQELANRVEAKVSVHFETMGLDFEREFDPK